MTSPVSPAGPASDLGRPQTEAPAPLRAVHTTNFPAPWRQLGVSLLVTTYQAGKLVMVHDEGDHPNTPLRALTGRVVAPLRFETAVQEAFAVVLPGRCRPELIDGTLLENSFVVPDARRRATRPVARRSAGTLLRPSREDFSAARRTLRP